MARLRKDIGGILEAHDFYHDIREDPEDDGYMLAMMTLEPYNKPQECKDCLQGIGCRQETQWHLIIPHEHVSKLIEALITRIRRADSKEIMARPSPEKFVKVVKDCMIPSGEGEDWWDEQIWLNNAEAAIKRLMRE
jgi:predicted phosphatase